ncbi:MAG: hypothetical protein ABII72_00635 [Parcubacteria group bacterium]
MVCLETGGSGRTEENNFCHHSPLADGTVNLSACAQALERLARLVRYVDEMDRGIVRAELEESAGFPSLSQLISGMLLVVRDPKQRMVKGLGILKAVLQSGIDPYGCMEEILDKVPNGRWFTEQKRLHNLHFEEVCEQAQWLTTQSGRRLAVVETTWIGAPGALYGKGANIVVALNPEMECGKETIRKFTVAGNDVNITSALDQLNKLETGWGGPNHGTICGSPQGRNSQLSLEIVADVVISAL